MYLFVFVLIFSFLSGAVFCFECFMFRYRAPRELLQGLHAATKLSSSFNPGVCAGQRSSSIKWSAVVAVRSLHQWQGGPPSSMRRLFFLNSAVFLVLGFVLRWGVFLWGAMSFS